VGGDLYAFYRQGRERLLVAVGDVSDKGVPAALFMARAVTLLQQYVNSTLDAAEIMAALNDELVEGNDSCMFLTLFIGWLDLDSLSLDFACGGHTPPTLVRDGQARTLPQRDGPALGLMEGLEFPLNRVQLQAEDRLALFTDGIEEAFNAQQQQFGLDAVNHVLQRAGQQNLMTSGQSLLEAVSRHQGEAPQADDITLLLLMPKAPESKRNRLTVEDDACAVAALQAWLDQLLQEASVGATVLAETRLVAEEVVTNVFKYGELPAGEGVTLTLEISPDRLQLEFIDSGIPFDPLTEAQRSELGTAIDSAAIGGLGVHLLEGLTDEQHYQRLDGKNRLTLVKFLGDR
jgi:sigma-B regulation protein RsbU (phosphoserine phosphatase)